MKFEGLFPQADIVGRRIWLSWSYTLDPLETPGDVPDMLIRRKTRDYAFPPLVPGDPYLIYDSATFPPAPIPGVLQVVDLPDEETMEDGLRAQTRSISVAQIDGDISLEIQRHRRTVFYDAGGMPVRVLDELLDASALTPKQTVYYLADDGSAPAPQAQTLYRGAVAAGDTHALNRRLWDMLPEVYRTPDVALLPQDAHVPGVPETSRAGGQLRRFVDMFGMGCDHLRSSAEGLLDLRDVQSVQPDLLDPLAQMIGWQGSSVVPLPRQRNELATANRLFDVVGTTQALSALVTQQVGWRTQMAEFAQNVTRANVTAQRSLYLRAERPVGGGPAWQGGQDAADVFDFPAGATLGGAGVPAQLTSANAEPFALRAGMELTLETDTVRTARLRFGPEDFDNINAATAAEVATALNLAFDDIRATDQAGALRIETVATGVDARLEILRTRHSLLALSNAPCGRIAALSDTNTVRHVFFADRRDAGWDEAAPHVAELGPQKRTTATAAPIPTRQVLMQKSWAHGEWRDAVDLPEWSGGAQDPTAALLSDGRMCLGWEAAGQLVIALGRGRAADAAIISGRVAGPFRLVAASQLRLTGRFGTETFTVLPADYGNLNAATAPEVAAAMNAQLVDVTASALPDGSLRLATIATGDDARLRVDLGGSNAARVLGFAQRDLLGLGAWDPAIDWAPAPLHGPPIWGQARTPSALADPLGGARLCWAEHQDNHWQLRTAHWSERITLATAAGLAHRNGIGGPWSVWTTVDGLLSDTVRATACDFTGRLWIATAGGLSTRRPDGVWGGFTTLDGLASNNIRDVAILPDGRVACATPAGLSEVDQSGAVTTTLATPEGLIGNNIRRVTADGHGSLWLATTAGVSRRDNQGRWRSWGLADGLPAALPRALSVAPGGRVALGTAAGVALLSKDASTWDVFTATDGLPNPDVRALTWTADGVLLAATAAGLGIFEGRIWRSHTTANGLPSNDLHAVIQSPEGAVLIGSAVGIIRGSPTTGWTLQGLADGLPAALVRGVQTGWSAAATIATGDGGNRAPHLMQDASGEIWYLWSHRAAAQATLSDNWTLRLRRWDPATWAWAAPAQAITTPPVAGARDTNPYAEPDPAGGARVFFETDRSGGMGLATVRVDAAGVAAPVDVFAPEPDEQGLPAVLPGPEGQTWLIHRSDAGVINAQAAAMPPPQPRALAPVSPAPYRHSVRVPEAIAVSHRAGARAPVFSHAARNAGQHRWGDAFTYSPQHPDRIDDTLETQTHLYTRRSIGLYLRQSSIGTPITQDAITSLRQMLQRLLPINLRLVLVVAPEPTIERVYTPERDIGERWTDNIPIVDTLTGLSDATSARMPDVAVLIANSLTDLSANPLDPSTFARRTWFPDLL